ncbi:MAG: hypothetical protein EPO06_01000 [Burkholderiaceae bacterium]|nr:MAG: hypothetical protein EPO06_01000 [Burkholderiaceae bacterium]
MADAMKSTPHKKNLCLWFALLSGLTAHAENLPDPTQPPHAGPAEGVAVQAPTQLHAVLIPAQGRKMAMIGATAVAVGDTVGDARVERIGETEVVLQGPEGTQVLRMMPAVEKSPVVSKSAPHKKVSKQDAAQSSKEKGTP